jgi:hypothetical protein
MTKFAPGVPILRGTFHVQMAALLPTAWAVLATVRPDRLYELTVAALVCEFQLIASARLHLLWHVLSPRNLKWTQSIDHCMIAVSVAAIGWVFGARMTFIVLLCLAHFWEKLVNGPHTFTRMNGTMIAATFVAVVIETVPVLNTWEQKMRFAICSANVVVAKLAYLAEWPCRGHSVWDYHDLSHLTTTAVMAIMFWEVLA